MTSARAQLPPRPGIERLRELEVQSRNGGGPDRVAKQHAKGKYTARERVDLLLEPGTWQEIDASARQAEDGVPGGQSSHRRGTDQWPARLYLCPGLYHMVTVVESMKMQTELKSPQEGRIAKVHGPQVRDVAQGEVLVTIHVP